MNRLSQHLYGKRKANEIKHGRRLANRDPNVVWGWHSASGRIRAKRRGRLIIDSAKLKPGIRVLEIGCGTGQFTTMFADTDAALTAMDISGHLLEIAKQQVSFHKNVRFFEGGFEGCRIGRDFEAIIGSSVLHHLDIDRSLDKMMDILNPGGRISFAEPNMLNPQICLQKNIPVIKRWMGDSPDETAFFSWGIKKRLLKAGFEKIEITPFDWLHPATPAKWIRSISIAGKKMEKIPFVKEFAGSLLISAKKPF